MQPIIAKPNDLDKNEAYHQESGRYPGLPNRGDCEWQDNEETTNKPYEIFSQAHTY
jgi:hypothetical protein